MKVYLKIVTLGSIYSSCTFIPIVSVAQNSTSKNCSAAIKAGKERLESIKTIQSVRVSQHNITQMYPDHPTGRAQDFQFSMKGPAVATVMGSPKFMTSIGQDIIRNCETIGKVTFALANSGWGISIGLLLDGHIGVFKCLSHPDPRLNIVRKLSWGEEYCSL